MNRLEAAAFAYREGANRGQGMALSDNLRGAISVVVLGDPVGWRRLLTSPATPPIRRLPEPRA